MAKTATLTTGFIAANIAGQKQTLTLTVTNGDGSNTNLVSMQPFATTEVGVSAPQVHFGTIANASTIQNNTGAAITILANSSSTFNFEMYFDGPFQPFIPNGVDANYYVAVTCQTSDGSIFTTPALNMTVNQSTQPPPNGQVQIIGSSTWAYANGETAAGLIPFGQARFDKGQHSAFIPLFG